MADYNYSEATNLVGTQKANNANFLAGQNAASSDFLNRYTSAVQGQEKMSAMANRIGNELNLPTLKENAYRLNKTVRELPQTYSSATRGFDVNANQLSRIIGQKSSELAPALATANEALAQGENTLNTQMGYETADQAKQLLPFSTEKELLSDRLAREATFYSKENENELNTIIAKIASGIEVDQKEKDRAQALAIAENNYKISKAQNDATINKGTIETIGGNKYLVNTTTGEKKLLGSASTGTGGSGDISKYLTNYLTSSNTTPTQTTNNSQWEIAPTSGMSYSPNSKFYYDPNKSKFALDVKNVWP